MEFAQVPVDGEREWRSSMCVTYGPRAIQNSQGLLKAFLYTPMK